MSVTVPASPRILVVTGDPLASIPAIFVFVPSTAMTPVPFTFFILKVRVAMTPLPFWGAVPLPTVIVAYAAVVAPV